MRRKTKQLLALLMTLVMCFATLAPTMVFAESTDPTAERIVTEERFDGEMINTAPGVVEVSQNGGFWFDDSREGGTYSLENDTLWYTCRRGQLIDIRFYHDDYLDTSKTSNATAVNNMSEIVEKLKGEDFILSYQLKAHHDAINIKSTFTEHYKNANGEIKSVGISGIGITDGTFVVSGLNQKLDNGYTTNALLDWEIHRDQWYLIEIAFDYDETVESDSGKQGAYTGVTLMMNGNVIATVDLKTKLHFIDMIRLGQDSVDECEIDNLTVATGMETLAGYNGRTFDSYTKRTHWIAEGDQPTLKDYAYSFAVVGDTQKVSRIDAINIYNNGAKQGKENNFTTPTNMDKIYEWIANNKTTQKIEYVLGLGDITEYGYGETYSDDYAHLSDIEWQNALEAISKLNAAEIPYSLTRGNHDGLGKGINQYFDNDTYKNQFSAGADAAGFFGDQGVANSYRAIKIGQIDYLFITLNYNPTDSVLLQAGDIIEQYPNHRVIITTHAYMYDDYTTISSEDYFSGYGNNDGEGIWNKLIRKYENIYLVMSGHIGSDLVQVSQVKGDHGNTVTQMLINFQVTDAHFGYTGMVTMLYFSEDGSEIQVRTYSPLQEAYFLEENQFTLNETIAYHGFSEGYTLCTSGASATIGNAGGLTLLNTKVTKDDVEYVAQYKIEDGILKFTDKKYSYLDLRLNTIGKDNIEQDFTLSFEIMGGANDDIGAVTIADAGIAESIGYTKLMTIYKGGQLANADGTTIATMSTATMSKIEIVLNYNPDKPIYSVVYGTDGKTPECEDGTKITKTTLTGSGGFSTYTVILNGNVLGTYELPTTGTSTINSVKGYTVPANFEHIDVFRMFNNSANDTTEYAIDNILVSYGEGSRRSVSGEKLWSVDFEDVTTFPTKDDASTNYFQVLNYYKPEHTVTSNGEEKTYYSDSKIQNGVVSLRNSGGQAFVDVMKSFYSTLDDVGDATLSMRIRPVSTFDNNYLVQMNKYTKSDSTTASLELIDTISGTNKIRLGTATTGRQVELSTTKYSDIELMFHYDYSMKIYTSVDLYVNGEKIDTLDISANDCAKIGYFRCFYFHNKENAGYDVDEMSLVTGAQSLYTTTMTEFVGYQTTDKDTNGYFNLRLISTITDNKLTDTTLNKYDYVGYNVKVSYKVGETTYEEILNDTNGGRCNKVFTSVMETDEMGGLDTITAESLGGKYIFALNVQGISTAWTNIQFSVTTYYKLAGYDEVFSDRTVRFTVDPATDVNQGGVN